MDVASIVSGIFKPIGDYFNKRQEIKAAEHTAKVEIIKAEGERKATLIREGLAADMAWETEFAQQARSSWKDEYTLIVVSIPLIMAFIPGLSIYVAAGFLAFAATPMWYQIMVQTIFYATYGIRLWRRQQSDT
jgi:hypothetical protein